jgi:uncharacterized protein
MIKRRDFIIQSLAVGGSTGLPALALGEDTVADLTPHQKVPRKELGTTGEKIPILLLGCVQKFNPKYDKILHRCYEEGIDYLDTALVYAGGMSQKTIEPFIKQVEDRKKLWITSKAPHHGNKADVTSYRKDLDQCLKDLQTDYLDMFFMHGIDNEKYLDKEYLDLGEKLKKEKKTRFFGFSCHDGNVVELMNKAAKTKGIDAIMFRYHFGKYGDLELNKAIDACKKAGIGLIAMKTMKSIPDEQEKVVKFQSKNFTLPQAKLKYVWADERIDSAVSQIDSVEKLKENADAAKSKVTLGMHEFHQLQRLHECGNPYYCEGCNHICQSKIKGDTKIADILRFQMYHDSYGRKGDAKAFFSQLSPAERSLDGVDFSAATAACPQGIDIEYRLHLARQILS